MEQPGPVKHWKEDLRFRKECNSSLNESVNSNRSSLSSGYNRFQFNRNEESLKRNSIFQFTARSRDNPHGISVLTKRNQQLTPRPNKVTTEAQLPQLDILKFTQEASLGHTHTHPTHPSCLQPLLKQFKAALDCFRSTISYFNLQFRQLQKDWDRTLTSFDLKSSSNGESVQVKQLRKTLAEKQKEIERMGRDALNMAVHLAGEKGADRSKGETKAKELPSNDSQYIPETPSPLHLLKLSKVEAPITENGQEKHSNMQYLVVKPSRTISLANLNAKESKEVNSLRQRLKKMKDALTSSPSPH